MSAQNMLNISGGNVQGFIQENHGTVIPLNLVSLLDYASERIFLQRVGGGYIFVHRMLLEHFARMK